MIRCSRLGPIWTRNAYHKGNVIQNNGRISNSLYSRGARTTSGSMSVSGSSIFLRSNRVQLLELYFNNAGVDGTWKRALSTLIHPHKPTSSLYYKNPKVIIRNEWKRLKGTNTIEIKSVKGKNSLKSKDISRLLSLAKPERWTLIAGLGCLLVSSVITMSVPFALGQVLDVIFQQDGQQSITNPADKLQYFCALLCGVFVLGGLANYGRVYLFNSASLRIVRDLRSKLYSSMIRQEVGWFDQRGTGELVNRLATDTYLIGNSLSQNLSDGLRSTVMIVTGTSMMIYTSPELTLIGMGVVPFLAGIAVFYGRYVRNITRRLLDKLADTSKEAEERLSNIKTVKMFCKEDEEELNYNRLLQSALDLGYKEVQARSIFFGMTGMSGNIIIISVLYYGGMLVVDSSLTIGALTSFILYAGYTAISINGLSNFYTELYKGVGSAHRIWEIFDRSEDQNASVANLIRLEPNHKAQGHIVFENVQFMFPSRPNIQVLNNLNLTLRKGETTAVVGKSGSGKTTLALLLLRLYEPCSGYIRLDGMNIQQISPSWIRSQIGTVNQEPALFSGSIRDNILYGLNPGHHVQESFLNEVIDKTHIREFTDRMPDGLETLVGQRGTTLSGGQKQRIAIARALIKNPAILILDEATSALDTVSEELVQNALQELTKGRTCLAIAHRLSTICNADTIAVMNGGCVVEQGTYDELIHRKESYFKELMKKQTFQLSV